MGVLIVVCDRLFQSDVGKVCKETEFGKICSVMDEQATLYFYSHFWGGSDHALLLLAFMNRKKKKKNW